MIHQIWLHAHAKHAENANVNTSAEIVHANPDLTPSKGTTRTLEHDMLPSTLGITKMLQKKRARQ